MVRSLEASWICESKVLLKTKWSDNSGLQGFPQQGSSIQAAGQHRDSKHSSWHESQDGGFLNFKVFNKTFVVTLSLAKELNLKRATL